MAFHFIHKFPLPMEDLRKKIASFKTDYNDFLVELTSVTTDLRIGSSPSPKKITEILKKANEYIETIDNLIGLSMQYASTDSDLQSSFIELMVSYRPRLECEMNQLQFAKEHPSAPNEDLYNHEFDVLTNGHGDEILREISRETEKIKRLKNGESNELFDIQEKMMQQEKQIPINLNLTVDQQIPIQSVEQPHQPEPTGFLDTDEEEEEAEDSKPNYKDDYEFPIILEEEFLVSLKEKAKNPSSKSEESSDSDVQKEKLQRDLLNSFLGINEEEEEEEEEKEKDKTTESESKEN
ncbi:hypothetical protein GPJ56_006911 [Histomonas meleagridis]|uniref:uncharacterized protein n=1 Tax=Histomonas meleagridis TaxID=135588 RepID=UPI00355A6031|nr:hypothetical protein GPJ56_006911 [Histomonas meleagridis]KAH0800278.1 hypothetical protein GO595_006867 [Histomonas meleagridis]